MPTLQKGQHPGQRREAGDAVLAAVAQVDARPIKGRVDAFARMHRAYLQSDDLVDKAEAALRAQQAVIGELDASQDGLAQALASALVGDGLPRINPFKALGFPPVSAIVKQASAEEARTLVKLAKKAAARADASKRVKDLARQLTRAAEAVLEAWGPIPKLEQAVGAALVRRNALGPAWEKAFAALKRAARAAADDGHEGLFEALFVATAPARPKAGRPRDEARSGKGRGPRGDGGPAVTKIGADDGPAGTKTGAGES